MKNRRIDGILFDKDGTLFDFSATWDVWAADVLKELSAGDAKLLNRLALAVGFDLANTTFHPHSPVIAGTNREAAECLSDHLPEMSTEAIERFLMQSAVDAPLAEAVPLGPLLDRFLEDNIALGVMTNDTELGALSHLNGAGVADRFQFIAGFDSGYGAKPSPEPLLAFSTQAGLDPGRVVIVGDSTHDLEAGRAAGMQVIGVLTGPASYSDLAPFADAVLDNIGGLPEWIATD